MCLQLSLTEVKVKKIKWTLVQALRLCTGRTARRGSRGIALLFLDHGIRREWGVDVTPRPLFTPGKDPVPIVQKAGWAPGPVWTGGENRDPTGIRSPDSPALSQSLYRLSYPALSRGTSRMGGSNSLLQADDEQLLFLPLGKTLGQKLCLRQKLHCNSDKSAVCVTFRGCSSTNTCGTKRDYLMSRICTRK